MKIIIRVNSKIFVKYLEIHPIWFFMAGHLKDSYFHEEFEKSYIGIITGILWEIQKIHPNYIFSDFPQKMES